MTDRTMLRRGVSCAGSAADTMRSVVVYDYRRNFAVGIVMGAEGMRSRQGEERHQQNRRQP
jgi:hypothetical protein